MGHFIDRFSAPILGRCPVAVDDIEQRIRLGINKQTSRIIFAGTIVAWLANNSDIMWQDYPESHHVEGG